MNGISILSCKHCREEITIPWYCDKCGVLVQDRCRSCHYEVVHKKGATPGRITSRVLGSRICRG